MRSLLFIAALPIAVSAVSLVSRQDTGANDDYDRIQSLCYPTNSSGQYDLNAPCNKVFDLEARCLYGAQYEAFKNGDGNGVEGDLENAPAEKQKTCICESNFWDYVNGCSNCGRLHGADPGDGWFPSSYISSMSEAYCEEPQTLGIDDFLFEYSQSTTAFPEGSSASGTDVLGTSTAVSLYFTPSASGSGSVATATGSSSNTGTAAAEATETGSGAGATATGMASLTRVDLTLSVFSIGMVLGIALSL